MWHKVENRKKFFEQFAQQNGFDPFVASNWYMPSLDKIMAVKGARSVIAYHGQSLSRALMDLFPDIGLEKTKFRAHKFTWDSSESRRKFFEKYAFTSGFDPLHPDGWYAQSTSSFVAMKGALVILTYHKNSYERALLDLFPNIGLESSKFHTSKLSNGS